MFYRTRRMLGSAVYTPDGLLGALLDCLVDIGSGEIGGVAVDPGGLLPHHVLLVPREAIKACDIAARRLDLSISREQALELDTTPNELSLARSVEGDTFQTRFQRLNRILDYRVVCKDGIAGTVSDFLIDPDGWSVRYLVVDSHELLPEHEVLIPVGWISEVNPKQEWVTIRVTVHRFRQSQHLLSTTTI